MLKITNVNYCLRITAETFSQPSPFNFTTSFATILYILKREENFYSFQAIMQNVFKREKNILYLPPFLHFKSILILAGEMK